jgi:hypothetical protein
MICGLTEGHRRRDIVFLQAIVDPKLVHPMLDGDCIDPVEDVPINEIGIRERQQRCSDNASALPGIVLVAIQKIYNGFVNLPTARLTE